MNFSISRGRRVIENTFGIMAAKWRVLLTTIWCSDTVADSIIMSIVVLHNYLIDESSSSNSPALLADRDDKSNGQWRDSVAEPLVTPSNMRGRHDNNPSTLAKQTRDKLIEFFNGVGAVEWQNRVV
jgi:hypothetical protein